MSLLPRPDFEALNSQIRYLMFSVFQVEPGVLGDDREAVIKEARIFFEGQADKGVVASPSSARRRPEFRRQVR
jgi:chlorite dismutase